MSTPKRIQLRRTKDPRRGTSRPCYGCGQHRARQGLRGYCSPECRFWSKVERRGDGECWNWTGAAHKEGDDYGRFDAGGRRYLAHRYAFETLVGPIPIGHELDHLCTNKRCVNPQHVEPVTSQEHGRRSGLVSGEVRRSA